MQYTKQLKEQTKTTRNTKTNIKINRSPEELQNLLWTEIEQKLRFFVKSTVEQILEVELAEHLKAASYERRADRTGYRNGYYERSLGTLHGNIPDISVPRLREGSYEYRVFDRYQRRAGSIDQAIGTLFLNGVSTRKLSWIAKELIGTEVSHGTVSNISAKLSNEDLKQFQEKDLKDDYRFLFFDGISAKVRKIGVEREMLLCGLGIKFDGTREIIGARLVSGESEKDWEAFLIDLKSRGLSGKKLELITIDGNPGLIAALKTIFPFKKRQRCIAHKLRNVASKVKRSYQSVCMGSAKYIFAAPSRQEAINRFQQWKLQWTITSESAVECLEKDLDECLAYYRFEKSVWKKIRTTNIIERSFREVRRRTRPMSIALSPQSTERIFTNISKGLNENWKLNPIKFTHKG